MSYATLAPVIGRTPDVPSSIRMSPVGEFLYVAFCSEAIQPHFLEVAGTLYVFLQDGLNYSGIVDAISAVMDRLPADSAFYGYPIEVLIQPGWIHRIVASGPSAETQQLSQTTNVRRHTQG
jgi:hypothetical protein